MSEKHKALNDFLELTGNKPSIETVQFYELALHAIYKEQIQKYYKNPEDHIVLSIN